MKDLILKHSEYIKSIIRGFDNSLNYGQGKFMDIINAIDSDTSITDKTIHNKFNTISRKIGFFLLRKKLVAKAEWLQNNSVEILKHLYVYRTLKNSVVTVDDNLYNWYINKVNDKVDMLDYEFNSFIFCYKDSLYYIEKLVDKVEIGILTFENGAKNPTYNLVHGKDVDNLRMLCNNTKCARWKNCLERAYDDKSKYCGCAISDVQKCGFIEECNRLEPMKALGYAEAIMYCMNNRIHSQSNVKRDRDEYEHIPRPERVDDVVVYYEFRDRGGMCKVSIGDNENKIPSSHASPREHTRRGGNRRGYYRKDGVYVRPTTFKSTTVNKGHTKTNYTIKERKSNE